MLPLPDGGRYLGFILAEADTRHDVEQALTAPVTSCAWSSGDPARVMSLRAVMTVPAAAQAAKTRQPRQGGSGRIPAWLA